MDEANHRRTLADRRRAALRRTRANVAGRIDTRDAGLEQPASSGVLAGEDETVFVPGHDLADPVGAGSRSRKQNIEPKGSFSPSLSVTASSSPPEP